MRHSILTILLTFVFISFIQSRQHPQRWSRQNSLPEVEQRFTQQQFSFDQVQDHFNYQNKTFWKQRYFVINNYFQPKSGPVYLFMCGEWVCDGLSDSRQWIVQLAQKTLGMVIILEHRFYGQSLPFGNDTFKLPNMKLLTSEQALSDTAYFISMLSKNKMHGIDKNPWITVGGSYPGALSAWFRAKYPHLTIGAIASSAVVEAIGNYQMFDEQMYLSTVKSGNYCWQAIQQANNRVEQILNSSQATAFKSNFTGGDKLKNDEFLFFWIDAIVMKVQYGERTLMCNTLKNLTTADQRFNYFIKQAQQHQVYEYGSYYLKNDTIPVAGSTDENRITARAWYYQSCTEFGFWQTPSPYHPLRSQRLNISFYRTFCADAYGEGTWPEVDRKNTETGGWNLKATNLFMVNGDEDPWKWASILENRDSIIAREADCDDCGHCPELYTPRQDDPPELKRIRSEQFLTVQEWIDDYWYIMKEKNRSQAINKKLISE